MSPRAVLFAAAAAAISGCALPTPSSPGAIAPARASVASQPLSGGPPTVLVSDAAQNSIVICPAGSACNSCKTVGSGLSAPSGLTTSSNGGPPAKSPLAYVADSGNHRVVVFTASCTTVKILNDADYTPIDVAVSTNGTVAVTNLCESSSCDGANIAFFAPKSTNITAEATGLMSEYLFGAFDAKGNFYNVGYAGSTVEVGVVPPNGKTDEATGITGIVSPGGLEVAHDGTIDIVDAQCPCIRIYHGTANVGTVKLSGVTKPISFAFDKKNNRVWLTDSGTKTADEFKYPKGGKSIYQYPGFSEPVGIAVIPPAAP
jgi:hypothetical protein